MSTIKIRGNRIYGLADGQVIDCLPICRRHLKKRTAKKIIKQRLTEHLQVAAHKGGRYEHRQTTPEVEWLEPEAITLEARV